LSKPSAGKPARRQPACGLDYSGLPLKVLWGLLDLATIAVLGSGLYLWIARRKISITQDVQPDLKRPSLPAQERR